MSSEVLFSIKYKNASNFLTALLLRTAKSVYFYASLLYVVYSIGIYRTDYGNQSLKQTNRGFLIYGIIHVISAILYALSWIGFKPWNTIEPLPDYLNIIGSVLWLYSATLYPDLYSNATRNDQYYYSSNYLLDNNCTIVITDDGSTSSEFAPVFYTCRIVELAAAVIEVLCGFLWVYVWYKGYMESYGRLDEPTAARGWTLDDPDFHANWSIIVCVIMYLVYEVQVYMSADSYETNYLYSRADSLYVVNSIFYFFAALRDLGWFWFMPSFGRFKSGTGQYFILEETGNAQLLINNSWREDDQERAADSSAESVHETVSATTIIQN